MALDEAVAQGAHVWNAALERALVAIESIRHIDHQHGVRQQNGPQLPSAVENDYGMAFWKLAHFIHTGSDEMIGCVVLAAKSSAVTPVCPWNLPPMISTFKFCGEILEALKGATPCKSHVGFLEDAAARAAERF